MNNFLSVSIKGAFNFARARVIWHKGMLKIFDYKGLVLYTPADEPVRNWGYLRAWDVKTEKGDIIMRGKCLTCGGKEWLQLMRVPEKELWEWNQ